MKINILLATGVRESTLCVTCRLWLVRCVLAQARILSSSEKSPTSLSGPRVLSACHQGSVASLTFQGSVRTGKSCLDYASFFGKWLRLVHLMSHCHLRRPQNHDLKVCKFRTDFSVGTEWKTQRDLEEEVKRTTICGEDSGKSEMPPRRRKVVGLQGAGHRAAGTGGRAAGSRSASPSDTLPPRQGEGRLSVPRAERRALCWASKLM